MMTTKDQLIQELETLPEELMKEALDFICFIKLKRSPQPKAPTTTSENIGSKNIGSDWWDNLPASYNKSRLIFC